MTRTAHRGGILIELLISSLISLLIGAGLVQVVRSYMINYNELTGQTNADAQGRLPIDIVLDDIRAAQSYTSGGGSCVQSGTQTSVTYYTSTSAATSKLWFDSANKALKRTTSAGTTTLVNNVTSLTLTYYVSGSKYSPVSTSWVTTTNPNSPSLAELPNVAAIGLTATVTAGGYPKTLAGLARIRCAPAAGIANIGKPG